MVLSKIGPSERLTMVGMWSLNYELEDITENIEINVSRQTISWHFDDLRAEAEEYGDIEDYLIMILARGTMQNASKQQMLVFLSHDIQYKSVEGENRE